MKTEIWYAKVDLMGYEHMVLHETEEGAGQAILKFVKGFIRENQKWETVKPSDFKTPQDVFDYYGGRWGMLILNAPPECID